MRTWWHWRAPCSTIRAGAGMPPTFWGARLPIRRPMTAASQPCGPAAASRGRTRREPRRPERRLQPAGSVPDTQLAQITPIGDAEFVRAHMQLGAEVDGDALRTLGFDDLAILLEHRILAPADIGLGQLGPEIDRDGEPDDAAHLVERLRRQHHRKAVVLVAAMGFLLISDADEFLEIG